MNHPANASVEYLLTWLKNQAKPFIKKHAEDKIASIELDEEKLKGGGLKHQVQQSQCLTACRDSITASKCSANTSIGILNPSTARGRVLSRCAMASSSS